MNILIILFHFQKLCLPVHILNNYVIFQYGITSNSKIWSDVYSGYYLFE